MDNLVPIPFPGTTIYYGELGTRLVVIVHDWYGRLPGLEFFANSIASHGYRVAVPDLYDGVATTDSTTAEKLLDALDIGLALATIDDVIEEGRASGSTKIAEIGFSMGGWLSLLHAQGGDVDAVVAYYATLDPKDHGVIPCPVLLHYAETDEWDDAATPEQFASRLRDHGTPVTRHNYAGTVHSFANANISAAIDPNAAALASARTIVFLDSHLGD